MFMMTLNSPLQIALWVHITAMIWITAKFITTTTFSLFTSVSNTLYLRLMRPDSFTQRKNRFTAETCSIEFLSDFSSIIKFYPIKTNRKTRSSYVRTLSASLSVITPEQVFKTCDIKLIDWTKLYSYLKEDKERSKRN